MCTKANKQKELGFEHIRDAEDTVDRMDQKMIHDKKMQVKLTAVERKKSSPS